MKLKVLEVVPAPLPSVELVLTDDEARVLTAMCGKISGYHSDDSPRIFLSELYRQLDQAGYNTRPLGNSFRWKGRKFKMSSGMRVDKE